MNIFSGFMSVQVRTAGGGRPTSRLYPGLFPEASSLGTLLIFNEKNNFS